MNSTDVLNMKLIDIINRTVEYKDPETGRKRRGKVLRVDDRGASVVQKNQVVVKWLTWRELEWVA